VPELYQLDVDPGERFNVAAGHPDMVRTLIEAAERERSRVAMAEPLIGRRAP
jgi:hypothetical protein